MKKFILLFALIALSINSCSDSGVDSSQQSFDGTIYYLSNYQAKLFRVNSAGKTEINTAKVGVARLPSSPVGDKLFYIIGGVEGTKPLVITDTEGTTTAPFTISDNPHALLSPNGNHVAYIENFNFPEYGITIYNTVSKTSVKLPVSNVFKKDIIFSPDGNKIAFFKGQFGDSLFTLNIDGTNSEFLLKQSNISSLDWSPNGEKIAYTHSVNKISMITVNNRSIQDINTDFEYEAGIKWMPDSKKLVYATGTLENGSTQENFDEAQIQMLDIETNQVQNLIKSNKMIFNPQISADGKSILYLEAPVPAPQFLHGSLKVFNLTTSQTVTIVADDAREGFWKK